ncbi:MAG: hypothetical protein ABIH89_03200 [Elusimicrobiota bacterium]
MKFNMISALSVGIFSGLVTTLIVVVLRQIWVKMISPWFEDQVYKDAYIEGKWYARLRIDDDCWDEIWELKRIGHKTSGTLTAVTGC